MFGVGGRSFFDFRDVDSWHLRWDMGSLLTVTIVALVVQIRLALCVSVLYHLS